MSQLCSPCMHVCENKTEYGYCRTTACINPRYNGSGTYVSANTQAIRVYDFDSCRKETGRRRKMMVRCCRCNNTIGEIGTNGKITSKCHKRVFEAEKCSITCEKCGWVTYFGQNPTTDCEHSVKQES